MLIWSSSIKNSCLQPQLPETLILRHWGSHTKYSHMSQVLSKHIWRENCNLLAVIPCSKSRLTSSSVLFAVNYSLCNCYHGYSYVTYPHIIIIIFCSHYAYTANNTLFFSDHAIFNMNKEQGSQEHQYWYCMECGFGIDINVPLHKGSMTLI